MWRSKQEYENEAGLYFERAMTGNVGSRTSNLGIALYYLEKSLPSRFHGISKLQDWIKNDARGKNKKKDI